MKALWTFWFWGLVAWEVVLWSQGHFLAIPFLCVVLMPVFLFVSLMWLDS